MFGPKQDHPGGGGLPTQFQPAQSGNPSGRPKVVAEVRALAQQYMRAALETLGQIMQRYPQDEREQSHSTEPSHRQRLSKPRGKTGEASEIASEIRTRAPSE